MTSRARLAAGVLAATAILTPTTAYAAAPSPYAQAAAAVQADGTLAYGKNIVSVSRWGVGRYCVRVGADIDLAREVVQVTPWKDYNKTYGVWTPHSHCKNQVNTLLVAINESDTKQPADAGFYLTIP
ncbi:hypothetical protein [Sphaerimonospora mesophila]|uniref:hypothetical protein n=1 Tax=Sphaerimonospora mesophila TaxID=37483 RepID=UPI0006E4455E